MASSPEAVHELLVKKSVEYAGRPQTYSLSLQSLGGKSVIVGNYGLTWKFQRKLLTSALRQYLSDIPLIERRVSTQAEKLVKFMAEQYGKPFDPAECLMRSVANVICGITYGEESDTTNSDLDNLLKLNADFVANDDLKLVTVLDFFPWARFLFRKAYERNLQPFEKIHNINRKIFSQREKEFDPAKPVHDLISCLLSAKYEAKYNDDEGRAVHLSDDHFIMTIEDMFLAGYETTSTTLRWLIAFLVKYLNYQEDIQRQLDEKVGKRSPLLDDRPNLPLIQATITETLRLGNTAPNAVAHVTMTDTTLCGYRVPKGTMVFPNTQSIHLDPKCWDNPTEFNPYRHIDKDGNLITNQDNFFPFGAGRRVCAGEALAKVELFLFVSWMLQHFTFVGVDGLPPKPQGAVIQFPSAYKIRAIKRERSGTSAASPE